MHPEGDDQLGLGIGEWVIQGRGAAVQTGLGRVGRDEQRGVQPFGQALDRLPVALWLDPGAGEHHAIRAR